MRTLCLAATFFSVFFLFEVSGRTYCLTGNSCQNSTSCLQYSGSGNGQWGLCCNGKCQSGPTTVYRGQSCDNVCTVCATNSASGSLFCNSNNICEAQKVTAKCTCAINSDCASAYCSLNSSTCQYTSEGNGYSCEINSQCLSANCSQTCLAQQLGGNCTTYNYPETCKNGFCPNWGNDPRSKICQSYEGVGGDCQADTNCQAGLQCIGANSKNGFSTCQNPPALGDPCINSTGNNYPCGKSNYECNNGKCVSPLSVKNGASCNNSYACTSNYCNFTSWKCEDYPTTPIGQNCSYNDVCAQNGYCIGPNIAQGDANCTLPKSVADGGMCYGYSGVCLDGSICNLNFTDFTYYCVRVKGKSCNPKNSTSDTLQCGGGYYCDCQSNTCQPTPTSTQKSCSAYTSAFTALGYPSTMNPLTMPKNVFNAYAASRCCGACWSGTVTRTASTGWTINCDSSGYSISEVKNNCNVTALDSSAFQACDKFGGATAISASPFIFILSLLSFLFH